MEAGFKLAWLSWAFALNYIVLVSSVFLCQTKADEWRGARQNSKSEIPSPARGEIVFLL